MPFAARYLANVLFLLLFVSRRRHETK